MITSFPSSGFPLPTGEPKMELACSIEMHVQGDDVKPKEIAGFRDYSNEIHVEGGDVLPEANSQQKNNPKKPAPASNDVPFNQLPKMQQVHVTENGLLGLLKPDTPTPTVTSNSDNKLGDALAMNDGGAKDTSKGPPPETTAVPASSQDESTGIKISQLKAILQPSQSNPPQEPAQSMVASDGKSETSKGKAESMRAAILPHTPGDAPQNTNQNDGSKSQPGQSQEAHPRVKSGGGSAFAPGSSPDSKAASGSNTPGSPGSGSSDSKSSPEPGSPPAQAPGSSPDSKAASELNASPEPSGSGSSGPGSSESSDSRSSSEPGSQPAPGSESTSSSTNSVPGSSSGPTGQKAASGPDSLNTGTNPQNKGNTPQPGPGASNSDAGQVPSPDSTPKASSSSGSDVSTAGDSDSASPETDQTLESASPGPGNAASAQGSSSSSGLPDSGERSPESGPLPIAGSGSHAPAGTASGAGPIPDHPVPAAKQGSSANSPGSESPSSDKSPVNAGASGQNSDHKTSLGSDTITGDMHAVAQGPSSSIGPDLPNSVIASGASSAVSGPAGTSKSGSPGSSEMAVVESGTPNEGPLPIQSTSSGDENVIAIGPNSYTIHSAGSLAVLESNTITPGAPAITIASAQASLGTNGILVAGSNTITLNSVPTTNAAPEAPDAISIGSNLYSIQPTQSGFVIVGSNTISKGAPAVTVASQPVSLAANGVLLAGSNTLMLGSKSAGIPSKILSQDGPAPSGNLAIGNGQASNNNSSSDSPANAPFEAGSDRSLDSVSGFRWVVGASTSFASFMYMFL